MFTKQTLKLFIEIFSLIFSESAHLCDLKYIQFITIGEGRLNVFLLLFFSSKAFSPSWVAYTESTQTHTHHMHTKSQLGENKG